MRYQLLEKDRINYICIVLLNEIINFQVYFPVNLTGEDIFLSQYLEKLVETGALEVKDGEYHPTPIGRKVIIDFYDKYYEYLKIFDIFCAVDLELGDFAFSRMFDPSLYEADWIDYMSNERFSDVRVAVADFKGLNPLEIVFMSFLTEGRFDLSAPRWQYNLTDMFIWDEMLDICNTAIDVDYLKEDGVLEDVIKQGTEIAMQLMKEAEEIAIGEETLCWPEDEVVEETTTVTEEYVDVVEMPTYGYDYFDPYYDPYYISPIWLVPILLW